MERLSKIDPEHPPNSHVDDISHVVIGETENHLKSKLIAAGRIMGCEVKRLQLSLSDKSKKLPVNKVTLATAEVLNQEGITISAAKVCDDVGVQSSAGTTRAAATSNTRINKKGADKARRTHELGRTNLAATKLVMPGVVASQEYGHQAMGASMTQMRKMAKNMKDSTPFAGTRACTTTVLALLFGNNANPLVRCPRDQIDMWIATWQRCHREDRHDTRFTWYKKDQNCSKIRSRSFPRGQQQPR